jgi:hypothetical protein
MSARYLAGFNRMNASSSGRMKRSLMVREAGVILDEFPDRY